MHILDWRPLSLAVARAFGAVGSRFATVSAELTEATADCLADCHELTVPTRHGEIRCLVYRAPNETTARPLYVNMHGGGFLVRFPEMDDPMCHYLVEHVGVTILSIDYDVAPRAPFPIAIEESVDVVNWAVAHSLDQNWDASRLVVGGQSAGGAIATAVARIARDSGGPAIALEVLNYPPLDLTIPGPQKRALAKHPVVATWMTRVFDPATRPGRATGWALWCRPPLRRTSPSSTASTLSRACPPLWSRRASSTCCSTRAIDMQRLSPRRVFPSSMSRCPESTTATRCGHPSSPPSPRLR
jgi:acetyl esterase/lipase